MNILWVQIRSWHAMALDPTRAAVRTFCGRVPSLSAEVVDTLPAEKSCETCLRIVARLADG